MHLGYCEKEAFFSIVLGFLSKGYKLTPSSASFTSNPKISAKVGYISTASTKAVVDFPNESVNHGTLIIKGIRVSSSKLVYLQYNECSPKDQPWSPKNTTIVSFLCPISSS